MKTPLAIVLGALPLAACISFGAKPPPSLLTLSSSSPVPVGQVQSAANAPGLLIEVPAVPASLATARVPVQASATSLAYVKDAQWAEPPARLFARLMADMVTARTGRVVLSTAQAIGTPAGQLTGELRTFGIDATTREAVVTFDGSLLRRSDAAIEKRRFEARVPVGEIDAPSVGPALNTAANQVAVEVADWIGR
ncbi:cholesterol transport system auxiliary component [Sphingomonas gellani]|uniref:Cholesterol transport system auxiliary component n=1 Tax=Sphingomonas gellani TaxID=1166340 RepID=A0A1H8CQR5_9SPHN|nr:ABC-type transport auxiliary lipoprotein family protein [Sphingomonas gellani]SEM96774.1 cholesterol transport system auxiliary component [Sphingomonas gellani]